VLPFHRFDHGTECLDDEIPFPRPLRAKRFVEQNGTRPRPQNNQTLWTPEVAVATAPRWDTVAEGVLEFLSTAPFGEWQWLASADSDHAYLVASEPVEEGARRVEGLMIQPPGNIAPACEEGDMSVSRAGKLLPLGRFRGWLPIGAKAR
jgi:hypothetical protein